MSSVSNPLLTSLIVLFLQTSKIIKSLSICTYNNYVHDILKIKNLPSHFTPTS